MRPLLPLIIAGILTVCPAYGEKMVGHMEPFPEEMLQEQIQLDKPCNKVHVVEWRETYPNTKLTDHVVSILNKTCKKARNNFRKFVTKNGYKPNYDSSPVYISFIPADNKFGTKYRGLNDNKYRFSTRARFDDPNGWPSMLWGYYDSINSWIYMRNDPLNEDMSDNIDFQVILTHELFHAFSYQSGAHYQYDGDKSEVEERFAEEFADLMVRLTNAPQ